MLLPLPPLPTLGRHRAGLSPAAPHRHPALACALALAAAMSGCQALTPPGTPAARVVIFGEQHDQPDHQQQVAAEVQRLVATGRLAAVVIEMADRGRSTAGLPTGADEAAVREALAWSGWEWDVYRDVVMAAVRAGVPVAGGNLPRPEMRSVMADSRLDAAVSAQVRELLTVAVREGHCNLLPTDREPGMVRIQIARDQAMAATVAERLAQAGPQQHVLLLTGAQHASLDRGVPLHLRTVQKLPADDLRVIVFGGGARDLQADERRSAREVARPDPCEGLRQRLPAPPARPAAM